MQVETAAVRRRSQVEAVLAARRARAVAPAPVLVVAVELGVGPPQLIVTAEVAGPPLVIFPRVLIAPVGSGAGSDISESSCCWRMAAKGT